MRVLLTVLLLLAVPSAAEAGTTLVLGSDSTERPQPYQAWLDGAHVPTPDARISLHLAPCPFNPARSCADPQGWIFLRTDHIEGTWKWALLHEVGHHFDYVEMTDADRRRFRQIVGDRRPWRASPNSPHEKFAEAWRLCARSARWLLGGDRDARGYDYLPTLAQHRRVCALIRRAGR